MRHNRPYLVAFFGLAVCASLTHCSSDSFSGGSKNAASTKKNVNSGLSDGDPTNNKQSTNGGGPDADAANGNNGGPGGSTAGSSTSGADTDGAGSGQTISEAGNGSGSSSGNTDIAIDSGEFACDQGQSGYVGKVYQLASGTNSLPNLDSMTPVGQVTSVTLDVPKRDFTQGFPGLPNLTQWFAIKFFALLDVPEDGSYSFRTSSDDGSKLSISDAVVVNNDGVHAVVVRDSAPTTLTKGKHQITIEWFQGPPKEIALQVYWKKPIGDWEIIPAQVLTHGSDCNLAKVGVFN